MIAPVTDFSVRGKPPSWKVSFPIHSAVSFGLPQKRAEGGIAVSGLPVEAQMQTRK